MYLPELFGIVFVTKLFIAELFARKIKNAVSDNVIAVINSAGTKYPVHPSAEYVLRKKCRYRTLSERPVFLGPSVPQR